MNQSSAARAAPTTPSPKSKRGIGRNSLMLALLATLAFDAGAATGSGTDTGRWITGNGNLEVEIAPCATGLCGTIVKVLANRSMSDPDKEMKPVDTRPAEGMQILSDFGAADDGEREGSIYNRENGKTYRCLMSLESPNQLRIRPYVGISWFGKTQVWNRVAVTVGQR